MEIAPHKMKFPSINKNQQDYKNDKFILNKLKSINNPDIHITTFIKN